MIDLQRDAMQSQLEELRAQVAEYEQLRASLVNQTEVMLELTQLSDLPSTLIRARIAKGWTQGQLAERLGVRVQQVQNDEATLYQSASFARLNKIATALGVVVKEAKVLVGK
jgi:ribosome-binding protein aMBF1 (putative translation factor)